MVLRALEAAQFAEQPGADVVAPGRAGRRGCGARLEGAA